MTSSLGFLFEAISQARNEDDMRSQIAPKIGEYFAANRRAIFFFESLEETVRTQPTLKNSNIQKILKIALSTNIIP